MRELLEGQVVSARVSRRLPRGATGEEEGREKARILISVECACIYGYENGGGRGGGLGKAGKRRKREEGKRETKQQKQSSARARARQGGRMRRHPFHEQAGKAMPRLSDVQIDEQGGTRNARARVEGRNIRDERREETLFPLFCSLPN